MIVLLNAFSFNMVDTSEPGQLRFEPLDAAETASLLSRNGFTSAVGHAETATLLSKDLGLKVGYARATVKLKRGDRAVIAQYIGPRLPEGATELPPGAVINYINVGVL